MITGIIMAAGFSRRMGRNKLLMEIGGVKLVERVIRGCKASQLDDVILVYRDERVKDIGKSYDIRTVYNPKAHLGQSESMKAGIRAAENNSSFMFLTGDQPFIVEELIDRLIDEYRLNGDKIIIPYYEDVRGNPTIFPHKFRDELLQVEGDRGGRDIIENYGYLLRKVYIDDRKLGFDVDDERDLNRIGVGEDFEDRE